jgi:hypothetical protein
MAVVMVNDKLYLFDLFVSGTGIPIEDDQILKVLGEEKYYLAMEKIKKYKESQNILFESEG